MYHFGIYNFELFHVSTEVFEKKQINNELDVRARLESLDAK